MMSAQKLHASKGEQSIDEGDVMNLSRLVACRSRHGRNGAG